MGIELQKNVNYQLESDGLSDGETILLDEFNVLLLNIKSLTNNKNDADDIDLIDRHIHDVDSDFYNILNLLGKTPKEINSIENRSITKDFADKYIEKLGLNDKVFFKDNNYTFIYPNNITQDISLSQDGKIKSGSDFNVLIKGVSSSDPIRGRNTVMIDKILYKTPRANIDGGTDKLKKRVSITIPPAISTHLNFDANFFGDNSSVIDQNIIEDMFTADKIESIKTALNSNSNYNIYIDGFTSTDGILNDNMDLSEARSEALKKAFLNKIGQDFDSRIIIEGYGETNAFGSTEKNRTTKVRFMTDKKHINFINAIKSMDPKLGTEH